MYKLNVGRREKLLYKNQFVWGMLALSLKKLHALFIIWGVLKGFYCPLFWKLKTKNNENLQFLSPKNNGNFHRHPIKVSQISIKKKNCNIKKLARQIK